MSGHDTPTNSSISVTAGWRWNSAQLAVYNAASLQLNWQLGHHNCTIIPDKDRLSSGCRTENLCLWTAQKSAFHLHAKYVIKSKIYTYSNLTKFHFIPVSRALPCPPPPPPPLPPLRLKTKNNNWQTTSLQMTHSETLQAYHFAFHPLWPWNLV